MTEPSSNTSVRMVLDLLARGCSSTPLRLGLFGIVALILALPALQTAGSMNLFRDAQVLMPYEDHAVETVRSFGQLPLWDPYYCGGIYALGTFQSRFASPTFLLSLLFGTLRAEPITVMLMLWLGLEGAFRYARSRGASALGSLLAAPVFAASGNFATSFFHGWIGFYGFALVPWALYGVRLAGTGSLRGAALAAVSLAWILGFGGTYAAPMAALLCALETLEAVASRIKQPAEALRAIKTIAVAALFALGLSAFRLLPVLETFRSSERLLADRPGFDLNALYRSLFGELGFIGNNLASLDGAFFVGLLAVPAAVIGALRLRSLPVTAVALASLWAATGYAYAWSPFIGLRELPLFSALRYPERYLIVVALALSVLAALGITRLESAAKKRTAWAAPLAVLSLGLLANLVPMALRHHQPVQHMQLAPAPPRIERPFHQARGTRWAMGYYGPMSRGCLSCWDAYPVPQSPHLRADLQAEEYLADPSKGSVQRLDWSPNRIDLAVTAHEPARLRVNQNWHPGWRASVGDVVSDNGLLSVDLPEGRHELTLRFLPRSAIAGALASFLAIVGLVWTLRARRARKHSWLPLALAAAPFALAASAYLLIQEASFVHSSPLTPGGEPVVVDDLPSGSTAFDVRFEPGVSLVGGRVEPDVLRPGDTLHLELDWRVDSRVSAAAGVFVHVVNDDGSFLQLDHTRMSSAMELAAAPRDRIVRDVIEYPLPARVQKGRWTVWVGVWNAFGDQKRLPVVSPGKAHVDGEMRVRLGSFEVR